MDLKYEVIVRKRNYRNAVNWCNAQFGEQWNPVDNRQGIWTCFWIGPSETIYKGNFTDYRFLFKEEKDALWFTLRYA